MSGGIASSGFQNWMLFVPAFKTNWNRGREREVRASAAQIQRNIRPIVDIDDERGGLPVVIESTSIRYTPAFWDAHVEDGIVGRANAEGTSACSHSRRWKHEESCASAVQRRRCRPVKSVTGGTGAWADGLELEQARSMSRQHAGEGLEEMPQFSMAPEVPHPRPR